MTQEPINLKIPFKISMDSLTFFTKLNKFSLYLLLVSVPIIFFPFTQNYLDFPKEILAQILIAFSFLGWLGKCIFKGELILRGEKVFYLVLFFILFSLFVSSLFSISKRTSFLGLSLDFVDSFLNFLLLIILAFLVVNSFEEKLDVIPLVSFFVFSGLATAIFNLFQLYKIFILPIDITKNISFNTVGTPNAFSVFSLSLLPISLVLALRTKGVSKQLFGLFVFAFFIFFLNLLFINFKTAWGSLIFLILILFVIGTGNKKMGSFWIPILMIGLIVSIFFYFFPATIRGFPVLPPEVSLSFISELGIIKEAFSHNLKNFFLGTGPTTFILDYSQYRSPLLNQTIFWGTRFLRGHSAFLDWFLTKGFLGFTGLIFLYFLIFYYFFKNFKKENLFEIKLAIGGGLISLVFVSLFYPFNFVMWFSFFFFLGMFLLLFSEKETKININIPSRAMFMNFVFVSSLILTILLSLFNMRWYLAEANYLKGVNESNTEKSIEYLGKATQLNPWVDTYWRNLSQLYLVYAGIISQDPKIPVEEKRGRVNAIIATGANAINRAVALEPNNVANWNVRGFFYQNLIGVEGADNLSLESYRRAIQLEPSSPFSFAEIGRVYILLAQNYAQKKDEAKKMENLNLASESLNKALEKKPDYPTANYLLAVVFDQQGKSDQAIEILEKTQSFTPQDFGIRFQLGMLYWRKGDLEKAQSKFEEALNINPNYSNAIYMLGLVFDKKGEKEKAKQEFEKVLILNPGNQEVKKILDNLEKGLPALEGLTQQPTFTPPPSGGDYPPEIKR